MSRLNSIHKKNALTLRKEKLIEELKYFERQIEEAKRNQLKPIENEESSDSDTDLPPLKIEPSIANLKIEHSALQTCFDATQELTGLQVLQSEVNVLVEDPKYDGEPLVTEDGIWREVTVECKVDLVPFSMAFYVHQPSKRFGGLSYRGLKVSVLKKPHEVELDMSILHELRRPSEAFEVLKAYSSAHRSRRSTLAQLALMYSSKIHMAPLADGGYQMKCGKLLDISWTLQNKSSPVVPFHHRMKFDLEYMDHSHIETVKAANKALSDPTIDTNERTSLLSQIITVCLEAQGINPAESTSESEAAPSKSELPTKRKRDEEAMAPPHAPPKKSRPKGKENKVQNVLNGKSSRDNMGERGSDVTNVGNEANKGSGPGAKASVPNDHIIVKENTQNAKRISEKDKKSKSGENSVKNKGAEVIKEVGESNTKVLAKNSVKNGGDKQVVAKSKEIRHHDAKKVNVEKDKKKPDGIVENKAKKNDGQGAKEIGDNTKKVSNSETVNVISKEANTEGVKKVGNVKDKTKHGNQIEKDNGVRDNEVQNVKKLKSKENKGSNEIVASKDKDTELIKEANSNRVGKLLKVNEKRDEKSNSSKKTIINREQVKDKQSEFAKTNIEQTIDKTTNQPNLPKDNQPKKKHTDKVKPVTQVENSKTLIVVETKKHNSEKNNPEPTKTLKKSTNSVTSEMKTKLLKNQFSNRRSRDINNVVLKNNTRIPQKALGSMQKIMKKNPLGITPRKSISKFKPVSPKIRKPFTHIPKLVKSVPK